MPQVFPAKNPNNVIFSPNVPIVTVLTTQGVLFERVAVRAPFFARVRILVVIHCVGFSFTVFSSINLEDSESKVIFFIHLNIQLQEQTIYFHTFRLLRIKHRPSTALILRAWALCASNIVNKKYTFQGGCLRVIQSVLSRRLCLK